MVNGKRKSCRLRSLIMHGEALVICRYRLSPGGAVLGVEILPNGRCVRIEVMMSSKDFFATRSMGVYLLP